MTLTTKEVHEIRKMVSTLKELKEHPMCTRDFKQAIRRQLLVINQTCKQYIKECEPDHLKVVK